MAGAGNPFKEVYELLLDYYGDQGWWPADDHFEVMVGAILTQNTAWSNVEKALHQLKQHNLCNCDALVTIELDELAALIRSSGYYNQKAQRLKLLAQWYQQQGGYEVLIQSDGVDLRVQLLGLKGIGDETADDIVLYAFNKTSFVIDSYTRRIFSRLGLLDEKAKYELLQQAFHESMDEDVAVYKQYHGLIVSHAKQHCKKKPDCAQCPLEVHCEYVNET